MGHGQVVFAGRHLVDGDGVFLEAAVGHAIGPCQEEEKLCLILLVESLHHFPEPPYALILFGVALVLGELTHFCNADGGCSCKVLANFPIVEEFEHLDGHYFFHTRNECQGLFADALRHLVVGKFLNVFFLVRLVHENFAPTRH